MLRVVSGILPSTDLGLFGPCQYLICRRADSGFYTGCWEFPGGKVEPGETDAVALAREWVEELSLDVVVGDKVYEGILIHPRIGEFSLASYLVAPRTCWVPFKPAFKLSVHDQFRWAPLPDLVSFSEPETPSLRPTVAALAAR